MKKFKARRKVFVPYSVKENAFIEGHYEVEEFEIELEEIVEKCGHHYDDNNVCEFCGDMEKCPSDDCTCDYCTDDRQEIASLPEIKETLEEMFINQFKGCYIRNSEEDIATLYEHNLKYLAEIAEVYHKTHPEEIDCVEMDGARTMAQTIQNLLEEQKGMVSIKEVKKILFQKSKSLFSYDKWWFDRDSVREAIEKLEE